MGSSYLCRWILIVALGVVLITPARADKLQTEGEEIVIGIVAVSAALVVGTVLIIHYSKKRTITGCVSSVEAAMTVTDEKDKQTYTLSGDTTGVKPGDRMRLQGKKIKPRGPDKRLIWETRQVNRDFGLCQP
ncbi:MAG TPA: hypothetical protein VN950_08070 [Terriglobales bacterium]|nr:hypothetical protein [Terriglobales bacterium]